MQCDFVEQRRLANPVTEKCHPTPPPIKHLANTSGLLQGMHSRKVTWKPETGPTKTAVPQKGDHTSAYLFAWGRVLHKVWWSNDDDNSYNYTTKSKTLNPKPFQFTVGMGSMAIDTSRPY